jgi:hypothetical protein
LVIHFVVTLGVVPLQRETQRPKTASVDEAKSAGKAALPAREGARIRRNRHRDSRTEALPDLTISVAGTLPKTSNSVFDSGPNQPIST